MSAEARIFRVSRLDCRVRPYDWPFARERADEIAAHWERLVSEKPTLYDGRVLLCRDLALPEGEGGALRATYFETSFSGFIAWRDFGFPDKAVRNCFSMAALRSADGAFLLGEMGAHTANAGQVYFPAGTPDLSDVRGEAVDLAASVARELREETGIDIAEARADPHWTIVALGPRIACMRPLHLSAHADAILLRVEAMLAEEREPELARMRAVRSLGDLAGVRAPDFIHAYLAHEFGRKRASGGSCRTDDFYPG